MNETECREKLQDLCAECGIPLSRDQAVLCCRHLDLVSLWNRRVNLTRVTGFEALVKHVVDSVLPARWLPEAGLALDVGSGAGFPGLPLGVVRPGLRFFLLDSDRKKASFLKVAVTDLGLKNVTVILGRLEDVPWVSPPGLPKVSPQEAEMKGGFDVITVRAVKIHAGMLQKMGALLAPRGVIAYWAGPSSSQALVPARIVLEGATVVERLEDEAYELPCRGGRRRLIRWVRRDS